MEQLYIIRLKMSSEFKVDSRKELDKLGKKVELTYHFEKVIRNAIQSTRMKYRGPILSNCLIFYNIRICTESQKKDIEGLIKEAKEKMKEIDQDLSASAAFLPLKMEDMAQGAMYQALIGSIKEQVYGNLFKKLRDYLDENKQIHPNAKKSMTKLLDQMRQINVTGDQSIDTLITNLKTLVENSSLSELRKELEDYVPDETRSRWRAIQV